MFIKNFKNENGHALIYVLLLITISFVLVIPMFGKVLFGTKEISIEMSRDRNNNNVESVMEITKGLVEANSINNKEEFNNLLNNLNVTLSNQRIFSSIIKINSEPNSNKVSISSVDDNEIRRDDSRLVFTFKTFENLFTTNKFVTLPGKKLEVNYRNTKGNNEVHIPSANKINSDRFEQTLQYKLYWFASSFPSSRENPNNSFMSFVDMEDLIEYFDYVSNEDFEETLSDYQNKNLYVNEYLIFGIKPGFNSIAFKQLWIAGNGDKIKQNGVYGPSKQTGKLTIDGSAFINGNLSISNFDTVHIKGDLVSYGNSANIIISNVNNLIIDGSIISNGDIVIGDNSNYVEVKVRHIVSRNSARIYATSNSFNNDFN